MLQYNIYDKPNLRKTVEGILYRMRAGCPWRDVPSSFGVWNSIYQQFNRWSSKNKLMLIFKALAQDPDLEWTFIDGTIVKAHQHSAGAVSSKKEALGKSVAGNTTKISMVADAYGLPIDFVITGGEVHDPKVAPELIARLQSPAYVIADRGYDAEDIRQLIGKKSATPVIPRKKNSVVGNGDVDFALYRHRHLVENLFAKIKRFRGIATRYDKLERNYASLLALTCAYLWLPM